MSPERPFDDAGTARAVLDAAGLVTDWNEGARLLLGHPAEEVVGRPASRLLAAPVDGPCLPADSPRWYGTLPLRHRDGPTLPLWVLAHRRPGTPDGRPGGWLVLAPTSGGEVRPTDAALTARALVQSPCATAVYDDRLRLRRINDAMAAVLGLPGDRVRGLRLSELGGSTRGDELEDRMREVLATGVPQDITVGVRPLGEERSRSWLARMAPVTDHDGRVVRGVCLTAHDVTENQLARERLVLVNEASVRIGTTLDVTRTAQELADVCVPTLADFVSVDLLDTEQYGGEPQRRVVAPVALRRVARRALGTEPVPRPGSAPAPLSQSASVRQVGEVGVYPASSPQAASLVSGNTVVASVGAGDLDAWSAEDPVVAAHIREHGVHSTMSVPIQARGTTLGVAVLTRVDRPDPFTAEDVLLAEEVTARAAVCIDNARRFSREREAALTLQRSLLPRTLPRTAALEAASRYLPAARAGVGGDWFDVIPLSGMRVAMVVGDVVGHGVSASATMGRLRTAVRTLADIDLAPDELLTHLDDLVVRLSAESGGDGSPGEVGASCLYAVYDPVSRLCTLARAGHPPPLMLVPGGSARPVKLPAGPPLGVGGLPFESAELELPEGTVLALYTDGLVEHRDRDLDSSNSRLREVLGTYDGNLDETCDDVLRALLPEGGAADDVALLLARTQGLPAGQVATWDVPSDPALVAPLRKQVVERLDEWALSDAVFTAELVVSELVTNAIRYGARPIRLRLIHDATTLICEVSDSSHTAPHLRRARTFDEGGRGLLLVAQLTRRWGTRHTADGKTIWAELSLFADE